MAKYLTLEEIIDAPDVEYREVPCPKWNGVVRLGSIDAETMTSWIEANENPVTEKNSGLRLLALSMVDENGKRIGTMAKAEALAKKDAMQTGRLVREAMDLNGLVAKFKEQEKNDSAGAPTGDSPTA